MATARKTKPKAKRVVRRPVKAKGGTRAKPAAGPAEKAVIQSDCQSDCRSPLSAPIPSDPLHAITLAAAGPYLIAVFRIERGKVVMNRYTKRFRNADLPNVVDILRDDLKKEVPWEFGGK